MLIKILKFSQLCNLIVCNLISLQSVGDINTRNDQKTLMLGHYSECQTEYNVWLQSDQSIWKNGTDFETKSGFSNSQGNMDELEVDMNNVKSDMNN